VNDIFIWLIGAGTIAGILFRPKEWPEAVWACLGAVLVVAFGLLSRPQAGHALAKGADVYLFLTGMMLLSELARGEGVFDWLASLAVRAASGSPSRLFLLIYLVGTLVTIFLSNDATAVVLTPAVYAAVKKADTKALPYLLICAFIAKCGELRAADLESRESRRLWKAPAGVDTLAADFSPALSSFDPGHLRRSAMGHPRGATRKSRRW
jgi:arsenical pump membrane protein